MADELRKEESPSSAGEEDAPNGVAEEAKGQVKEKKSFGAVLKGAWSKTGLDLPTVITMAKGGLPPTIALAMSQSTEVADVYITLSYLVAIVSILGFAILPRARFAQTMLINLVAICLGAAMALLEFWCSTQARKHTTPPKSSPATPADGTTIAEYNSSASAVSAIWLIFQIYIINTLRAKYQQLAIPSIIYSIFVIVASTYAPQFPTMSMGMAFAKRLLETFLTGFAITTGVHIVIFPATSRKVVFMDFTKYFGALQGALKAHRAFFNSLEEAAGVEQTFTTAQSNKGAGNPKAAAVRAAIGAVSALHGKLQADLSFAKREIALGQLGPDDLKEMNKLIRFIMLPVVGLSSMTNIYDRVAEAHGWTEEHIKEGLSEEDARIRDRIMSDWQFNMRTVHKPLDMIVDLMNEGMDHCMYQLHLKDLPKEKKAEKGAKKNSTRVEDEDVEAKAESTKPGDKGFAKYFAQKAEVFHGGKQEALTQWCERKGIDLPPDFFEHPYDAPFTLKDWRKNETAATYLMYQRQLFMLLYMEFLLYSTSQAILDFIKFADEAANSGKMSKTRLIVPGFKRTRKWIFSVFKNEDETIEEHALGDIHASTSVVSMGQAYYARKDPEHLPPTNALEKFGNVLRSISAFFRSPESTFGLRVIAATMCIGIVAFLHRTQAFFTQNRLLWAMIMVAISMTPTAGQSIFSFSLRIFGTVCAMCIAFLVYYIPDGHIAGILVFLWFFASCGYYIVIKQPAFTIIGMISIVTTTLTIGYELEVRKLGIKVATSNGQSYLPIYELAPYRLATVAGGLLVAFIWTIIPYPITEHSALREDLAKSIYLVANFYSVIHETVNARIRRDEGDLSDKMGPGYRLQKARLKVFSKTSLVITSLKQHLNFLKWEIPIGGKFPKKQYAEIIDYVERITNYIALIGYASQTFAHDDDSRWSEDFRKLMVEANYTSHEITTLLSLLSSSIKTGQCLPPYLRAPRPYGLSAKLEDMDSDILSVRHIAEPGYSAFAVVQICSRCVVGDLDKLLKTVKNLVGELDFSFHIISTTDSSTTASTDSLLKLGYLGDSRDLLNAGTGNGNGKEVKND